MLKKFAEILKSSSYVNYVDIINIVKSKESHKDEIIVDITDIDKKILLEK
jgi:hypothetical protein